MLSSKLGSGELGLREFTLSLLTPPFGLLTLTVYAILIACLLVCRFYFISNQITKPLIALWGFGVLGFWD